MRRKKLSSSLATLKLLDDLEIAFAEELDVPVRQWVEDEFREHEIEEVGEIEGTRHFSFIARKGNQHVGVIAGKVRWGELNIKSLIVEKDFRGQGIARKLLDEALDFGRKNGCRFVTLKTRNYQAETFYELQGFEKEFIREGYDHGISIIYMRKKL